MLNQVAVVGRIYKMEKSEGGMFITLKVSRPYKNDEGLYEDDYIKVFANENIMSKAQDLLKENDLIGVKGMLKSQNDIMQVYAEKLTYLAYKGE